MWVFDGEEWIEDGGRETPRARKPELERPRYEEMMPELQVVEVLVPLPKKHRDRPLPLP